MQTTAVGWQLYELTYSAYVLGGVGLVQVLPLILLALPAGHVADRYNRRRIMMIAEVLLAMCALGLAGISLVGRIENQWLGVAIIYLCLFVSGVARAFEGPARAALLPQVVPRSAFTNAVTWASGGFQLASVIGPALGGLLIAQFGGASVVYVANAVFSLAFFSLLTTIKSKDVASSTHAATLEALAAGVRFVRRTRVILAAITLDMFAVLFGGATALLPAFADDILHTDAIGYGLLCAAQEVGSIVMAVAIAHAPPLRRSGATMLAAVAVFGACMIGFALSPWLWVSIAFLFVSGLADTVSVVIRSTIIQVRTPSHLRGRVASVNAIFVGSSNEIGAFESGVAARYLGLVPSVVVGGAITLAIVGLTALRVPALRRLDRVDQHIDGDEAGRER